MSNKKNFFSLVILLKDSSLLNIVGPTTLDEKVQLFKPDPALFNIIQEALQIQYAVSISVGP